MKETWLPIPGHEGYYDASSLGRIRSCPRKVAHKKSGFLNLPGKVLTPTIGENGYHYISTCVNAIRKKRYVHDLVCITFYGVRPVGHHVDHEDRDRLNNLKSNLSYKTIFDNCSFPGESSGMAVLTEKQVKEIREKYIPRIVSHKMLADEYGVEKSCIGLIIQRKNWKHIK